MQKDQNTLIEQSVILIEESLCKYLKVRSSKISCREHAFRPDLASKIYCASVQSLWYRASPILQVDVVLLPKTKHYVNIYVRVDQQFWSSFFPRVDGLPLPTTSTPSTKWCGVLDPLKSNLVHGELKVRPYYIQNYKLHN